METLWQDLKYGVRMLAKSPGVSVLAVLALSLGIGANTAIFSVANAFILKPFDFPNLDRLVQIWATLPQRDIDENSTSHADFEDWKSQSRSFERLEAFAWDNVNLTGDGIPEKAQGFLVTPKLIETLGVKPVLGRAFLPEEEQPGHDQVVILGHGLWERRYGSDPNILGRTVRIDGQSCTIIGVMAKGFSYPPSAELWVPLAPTPEDKNVRKTRYLFAVGLRKPDVSISKARAEMVAIAQRLEQQYPDADKGWGVRVLPLREAASGDLTREYTLMLLGAVGFVLLIACANVAGLQFARAAGRQREIALRATLGATRRRILRQLLTESILLSLAAAVLGLGFAQWSLDLILSYMSPEVARFIAGWQEIRLDRNAFLFTLGAALVAGILSGLAPALHSSRPDLNEALKEGGRTGTAGRSRQRIRSVLVVAEVALSLVLLLGAGLLVKGFHALVAVNQNLAPESLLAMRLNLPDTKYSDKPKIVSFYEQTLRKLEAIPGVEGAATATSVPYGNSSARTHFSIAGQLHQPGEAPLAYSQSISPNYFRVMRVPLLSGREFSDADGPDSPPVAIVSESLARSYFPGENAIGKRIKDGSVESKHPWATIVGVAADVKNSWMDRQGQTSLYQPFRQAPRGFANLVIRAAGDPNGLISAARSGIASVDPDQPVFDIMTLQKIISNSILGIAYVAVMMAVIGVIALVLSVVGVYGLMAYSVTERTHEIGVRMALGAQPKNVLRLFLGRGVLLTALGLAIGLPIAFVMARLLASLLFGVSASDPGIFIGISGTLTAAALAACYLPARRATRVDPMVALRYE